jgi:hypothetical protein
MREKDRRRYKVQMHADEKQATGHDHHRSGEIEPMDAPFVDYLQEHQLGFVIVVAVIFGIVAAIALEVF